MSAARQALGGLGERIAERWLRRRGWTVVQRRFRSGHRDIDLVVERDGTVAFVEVKARRGAEFGGPVQAVDHRKRKQLERSALHLDLEKPRALSYFLRVPRSRGSEQVTASQPGQRSDLSTKRVDDEMA